MAKATRKTSTTKKTTIATDPIFAAIECHRKLDRAWLNLEAASGEDYARIRASEAAEEAAWKMAQTEPSTTAGCAEMLKYITTGPITGLFELGETSWHETAFRTVAASLAKITGQSRQAA